MNSHQFQTIDEGKVIVATDFLPTLQANEFDTFGKIMAYQAGPVVRAVPGRSTVQVQLLTVEGQRLVCYLKRYEAAYLSRWKLLLRAIHWPGADDEAEREWRKILVLRSHGILTAAPIALGQRRSCGAVTASFLLQQEIVDGVPADEYFLERLVASPPLRKWQLLARIGKLASSLHGAGLIHKDLYLKHIFVVECGVGWDLFLIDLQRVLGPRHHRRRWYLKDLGALAFSAQTHARLSRTNLLRLYHAFANVTKLGAEDRKLILRIWQRVRKLRQRRPKYRRVWNAPPAN